MTNFSRIAAVFLALFLLQGCQTIGSILPWNGKADELDPKVDLGQLPPEQLYTRSGTPPLSGSSTRSSRTTPTRPGR